ncbi:Spy/CpxP family protein refolding chaperone [Sulfurimonas sp.]
MKTKFLTLLMATTLLTTVGTTTLSAAQKQQAKPFLIQGKLPHLTMMVKAMWDDKDLALTSAQKKELLKIRKKTITAAKSLNKKIMMLEDQVVLASNVGENPKKLKKDVYDIATYRAQATMVHLECIYNTRKVLTQEQLDILE